MSTGKRRFYPDTFEDEAVERVRIIKPEVRAAMNQLYATGPDRVAALSTRGVRRAVPDTGHDIQLDRPETVEAAIDEVLGCRRAEIPIGKFGSG